MSKNDLLVLSINDVANVLKDHEAKVVNLIKDAYVQHYLKQTSLPLSTFLRFPGDVDNRIISLPAFIGGTHPAAGVKWIASFPDNIKKGMERASAMLILNSVESGRPYCVMEASLISAWRTAASAALAVKLLSRQESEELVLIGCGPINKLVAIFVSKLVPSIRTIGAFDINKKRTSQLIKTLKKEANVNLKAYTSLRSAIANKTLISIATNVSKPIIHQTKLFLPSSLVLDISLRDLSSDIVLNAHNVVDDPDHANRENTSIYLASQKAGHTQFINNSIGAIAKKGLSSLNKINKPIIFSPFGLGILDIKLAQYVYEKSLDKKIGRKFLNFLS